MTQRRRWALFIFAVAAVDLALRFATGFDIVWVVRGEALLLLGTSLVLWIMHRRSPAQARWHRRLQRTLVAAFALAGVRAALWAAGLPVATANLVILVVGVLVLSTAIVRARR